MECNKVLTKIPGLFLVCSEDKVSETRTMKNANQMHIFRSNTFA